MLPSRSGTRFSSFSSRLLVMLTVCVILSSFSLHAAAAGRPLRSHTGIALPDMDSLQKTKFDLYRINPGSATVFPQLPRLDPENVHMRPFTPRPMLPETTSPSLWLGDDPLERIDKELAEISASKLKPSFFPPSGKESTVIVRRGTRASGNLHEIVVPFKPSLSGGAIYYKGEEKTAGRFVMDLLLPARMGSSSLLFFESRAEYQNSFSPIPSGADRRFDLGLGLGWRKVWDDRVMVGANVFADTSRLYGEWSSSPGFGFEFALSPSVFVWDTALNVYRGGGIDLRSGLIFPILNEHLDMRLYAEKYRFFDGEFILGSKGGVEVSLPGRLLAVTYEYGQDSRNPEYHALGCSLSLPFSVEKMFSGKNPFALPEPKSRATRYAKRLQADRVKRTWNSPDTVVEARHTPQGKRWTTPGRLTDTIFRFEKASTEDDTTTKAPKSDTDSCREHKRCCECERDRTSEKESTSDCASTLSAFKAAVLVAIGSYFAGDYAYRNAFGPFELEPYELERIRKEMPKKRPR